MSCCHVPEAGAMPLLHGQCSTVQFLNGAALGVESTAGSVVMR